MRKGLLLLSVVLLSLLPFGGLSGTERDGRAGAVVDLSGTAVYRSMGHERWTRLESGTVLAPGDAIKVLTRGANAVEVALAGGGAFVLGPGGRVELTGPDSLHLLGGEIEVTGRDGAPVTVKGPGGFNAIVRGVSHLLGGRDTVGLQDGPPAWLTGYRQSTSGEWLGSLVADVDGRNVPLRLGFHHVEVVIRDQIAETTITESFVNATSRTLEGEFVFPLPAGASVSGFGMWIDDELVMADLVERKRAREIYEDIKSRKKDPGLLEWSGGNLFKARVFPIPPSGEKRIRIRYTRVLPLTGDTYRYRYPLRSEMLRHHPLEKLSVRLSVHSTTPIADAVCLSHEAVTRTFPHTARIEYEEEDATPDRDFEASVRLGATAPLTVIPHRRGEDGYFMLLLSPPAPEATDAAPRPLDLLLLADTSGSVGPANRKTQADFIQALLALLGKRDHFRLATVDRGLTWLVEDQSAADDETIEAALELLDARPSLGWTDLDGALATALTAATKDTQIVYLGDGVGTKDPVDAGALAARIRRLTAPEGVVCHAFSTGSSFESMVLDALAAHGGGTVRAVNSDPARTAATFIEEISVPAVKDLTLSIEGVRTARVYPTTLPRLPAGSQQVILGRFLPTGGEERGKVVVRGSLQGRPVQYAAPFHLAANEEGNSFLPRLWARRHLDALLGGGITPANRDEIVEFSQRFGIITPLTSFLVLENDEDRERYGVKRTVGMRDGERFFAEARDRSRTDARREQMRAAAIWRTGLRKQMLAGIRDLGRRAALRNGPRGGFGFGFGGGGGGSFGMVDGIYDDEEMSGAFDVYNYRQVSYEGGATIRFEGDGDGEVGSGGEIPPGSRDPLDPQPPPELPATPGGPVGGLSAPMGTPPYSGPMSEIGLDYGGSLRLEAFSDRVSEAFFGDEFSAPGGYGYYRGSAYPFPTRFPYLAPAVKEAPKEQEFLWSKEAVALAKLVAGNLSPAEITGGLEVHYRHEVRHRPDGPVESLTRSRTLLAPRMWFTRHTNRGTEPEENWLADGRCGSLRTAVRLGRRRAAEASDYELRRYFPGLIGGENLLSYARWNGELGLRHEGLITLRLTPPRDDRHVTEFLIDPTRRVIVEERSLSNGKVTGKTTYSGFVSAEDRLWPTEVVTVDAEGRALWHTTIAIKPLDPARVAEEIALRLTRMDDVIFLPATSPTVQQAKQAVLEGQAGLAERLRLLADHASFGRKRRAGREWAEILPRIEGKPGALWLRVDLLAATRQGEELERRLASLTAELVRRSDFEAQSLAELLREIAARALSRDERIELIDRLRPIWDHEDEDAAWRRREVKMERAGMLLSAGRLREGRAAFKELLAEFPGDRKVIIATLYEFQNQGFEESFLAVAREALPLFGTWSESQAWEFSSLVANHLFDEELLPEYLDFARRWMKLRPKDGRATAHLLVGLHALDRYDELQAFIGRTLSAGVPEKGDAAARQRLRAVVDYLGGNTYRAYLTSIEKRWVEALATLARDLLALEDDRAELGAAILRNSCMKPTDAGKRLVEEALRTLTSETDLPVSDARLRALLTIFEWQDRGVTREQWKAIADHLARRYRNDPEARERNSQIESALRIYDRIGEPDAAIALLEEVLLRSSENRAWTAGDLSERISALPYTAEREDRLLGLLPDLIQGGGNEQDLLPEREHVTAWIVNSLLRMRTKALLPTPEEKLTRAESRLRFAQAGPRARRELAERLSAEEETAIQRIGTWWIRDNLQFERLNLLTLSGSNPEAVEAKARELLLTPPDTAMDAFAKMYRRRSLAILDCLAVRGDAPAELVDRVVATRREAAAKPAGRPALFRLLVALDRTEEVEALLEEWIEPDRVESTWRVALAYLRAERGEVREAVKLLEEVAGYEELTDAGYQDLADWLFVLGEDKRRDEVLRERIDRLSVRSLGIQFQTSVERLDRDSVEGATAAIEPETVLLARALLRRSPRPTDWLDTVLGAYQASKDFRLLDCLADGVVGHSPGAVYELLEEFSGSFLDQVHEEATLDELTARIFLGFTDAETDTDRRGLRLLLALSEGRAANVKDEPGPHGRAALDALQAAFPGSFETGERGLLATFLANLDSGGNEAVDAERLRQLRLLLGGTSDPVARWPIAQDLATVEWECGDQDRAIDTLTAELPAYREACGGALDLESRDAVESLVFYLGSRGRFEEAERLLADEEKRQSSPLAKAWYRTELLKLGARAFREQGSLAAGDGEELYRHARDGLDRGLTELPVSTVTALLPLRLDLAAVAKGRKIKSAAEDLVTFSRDTAPLMAARIPDTRERLEKLLSVAQALKKTAGPVAEILFLMTRLEAEPEWYRAHSRNGWNVLAREIAGTTRKMKLPPEIDQRLLALCRRELERDLLSSRSDSRHLYGRRSRGFMKHHAEEFAALAREILAAHANDQAVVLEATKYLYRDLKLEAEATDLLSRAAARGAISMDGRETLTGWLLEAGRSEDALEQAHRLNGARPNDVSARMLMIRSLHACGKKVEADAFAEETELWFERQGLLDFHSCRKLARLLLELEYYERSASLFSRMVDGRFGHESRGYRRDRDELARSRCGLARSLAGLGKYAEAIDEVLTAVVTRTRSKHTGEEAERTLVAILASHPDLDAWAADFAAEVAKTGLDAPVLRAALGDALLRREQYERALVQLRIARRLTPGNEATHRSILKAARKTGRAQAVTDALLGHVRAFPRKYKLYDQLALHYETIDELDLAERAWTTMIEVDPFEPMGCRELARVRERQKRGEEAGALHERASALE
jgi:Vault protein inter-alpha-trypsin domain/von Willebrand factor type A domain